MPARRGFAVCFKHGAGTRKRIAEGTARRSGRPRLHGLYTDVGRASVREEVRRLEQANIDLDTTEREMLVAKAVNVYLLNEIDRVQDALAERQPGAHMSEFGDSDEGARLQARLDALVRRLSINCERVVTMVLRRAQIKNLVARDLATETVHAYVAAITHILWDLLDDDELDVFEERLRVEVFGPLGDGCVLGRRSPPVGSVP